MREADYERCRQQLKRLSSDELFLFDAYGRQHRDPDDIAGVLGLTPNKVIARLESLAARLQPIAHLIPWMDIRDGDHVCAAA